MTENPKEDFRFDAEQEQVLDAVTALIMADELRPSVLNVARYSQMAFAYAVLQKLASDAGDITLTRKLHQPFKSVGSISLEGESLEFCNSPLFPAPPALPAT